MAAKSTVATKPGKVLRRPKFSDRRADEVWTWAVSCYQFEAADKACLALFCDMNADYERYKEREAEAWKAGNEKGAASASAAKYKAFVQITKLLQLLGMTPAQRKGIPVMNDGPTSRPDGDDFGD